MEKTTQTSAAWPRAKALFLVLSSADVGEGKFCEQYVSLKSFVNRAPPAAALSVVGFVLLHE